MGDCTTQFQERQVKGIICDSKPLPEEQSSIEAHNPGGNYLRPQADTMPWGVCCTALEKGVAFVPQCGGVIHFGESNDSNDNRTKPTGQGRKMQELIAQGIKESSSKCIQA